MIRVSAFWVMLLLFSVNCLAENKATKPIAPFDLQEYAAYQKDGQTKVDGQAFMRTRGGDVRFAAGSTVLLFPATTHGIEWAERMRALFDLWKLMIEYDVDMEKPVFPKMDARADGYTHTTIADGGGNFHFDAIAPGEYIVFTNVFWEIPVINKKHDTMPAGGFLVRQVSVPASGTIKVILQ